MFNRTILKELSDWEMQPIGSIFGLRKIAILGSRKK